MPRVKPTMSGKLQTAQNIATYQDFMQIRGLFSFKTGKFLYKM
jgi:hypothetical protein